MSQDSVKLKTSYQKTLLPNPATHLFLHQVRIGLSTALRVETRPLADLSDSIGRCAYRVTVTRLLSDLPCIKYTRDYIPIRRELEAWERGEFLDRDDIMV